MSLFTAVTNPEADMVVEFKRLCRGDLSSLSGASAVLRFARAQRASLCGIAPLVARLGGVVRAIAGSSLSLGDEYWLILEQTLIAAAQCGADDEAAACLAALEARFGRFRGFIRDKGVEVEPEEVAVAEKGVSWRGSTRVRRAALLVAESKGGGSRVAAAAGFLALDEGAGGGGGHALPSRRLCNDGSRSIEAHLELHGGDADAWRSASENASEKGLVGNALFAVEEMVLITPGSAAVHARASELGVAVASSYGNRDNEVDAARLAVRTARLHASEAVRLSDRSVAYALAALADSAWAHAALLTAPKGQGRALPAARRLLTGDSLAATALRALKWLESDEGCKALKNTAALEAMALVKTEPLLRSGSTTTSRLSSDAITQVREAIALHALAVHDLNILAGTPQAQALVEKLTAPAFCQNAPLTAVAFPALTVDAMLLWSTASRNVLGAQINDMTRLVSELDSMESGGGNGAEDEGDTLD
jgi:hypothetical protein